MSKHPRTDAVAAQEESRLKDGDGCWDREAANAFYELARCLEEENERLKNDAERFRWLADDHSDKETREKCAEILERMQVLSYSAASQAIDQARYDAAIRAVSGAAIRAAFGECPGDGCPGCQYCSSKDDGPKEQGEKG